MHRTWNRAAEPLQPRADDVGDCAADAGIDLVEDERLARRVGRSPSVLSASMMRDSSPPEAMRASGRSVLARDSAR